MLFTASLAQTAHGKVMDSEPKAVSGNAHHGTSALVAKRRLSHQGRQECPHFIVL